jgi:molecular chaperone DnaK (HSP70)
LAKQTIERAKFVLANLFESSDVSKDAIDEVIIVGGCSRIPAM